MDNAMWHATFKVFVFYDETCLAYRLTFIFFAFIAEVPEDVHTCTPGADHERCPARLHRRLLSTPSGWAEEAGTDTGDR